jgi:hypothetical protein
MVHSGSDSANPRTNERDDTTTIAWALSYFSWRSGAHDIASDVSNNLSAQNGCAEARLKQRPTSN